MKLNYFKEAGTTNEELNKIYETITKHYPTKREITLNYCNCKSWGKWTRFGLLQSFVMSASCKDLYNRDHFMINTNHCWAIVTVDSRGDFFTVTKIRKVLKGFDHKYTTISKSYTLPTCRDFYVSYVMGTPRSSYAYDHAYESWCEEADKITSQIWDIINNPKK